MCDSAALTVAASSLKMSATCSTGAAPLHRRRSPFLWFILKAAIGVCLKTNP